MTVLVSGDPEYRAECDVWQNITDNLMQENSVPMNCDKNVQCTGIECSCEFRYSVSFFDKSARLALKIPSTVKFRMVRNDYSVFLYTSPCVYSQGIFSGGSAFVEDFCFGVAIHPCKTPLEMHFFVENPNEPAEDTYQQTITNGTSFRLPGIQFIVTVVIFLKPYCVKLCSEYPA